MNLYRHERASGGSHGSPEQLGPRPLLMGFKLKLLATSGREVILGPGLYLVEARVEGGAFTGVLSETAARAGLQVQWGLLSGITILISLRAGACLLPSSQPY